MLPTRQPPAAWLTPSIPIYAPRADAERAADPYDRDTAVADLYTGIAFGHLLFAEGAAEALYRTLAALLLARRPAPGAVLDIGCGAGRVIYDCAPALADTHFTALDFSYQMCLRAAAILQSTEPVPLPFWSRRGRNAVVFEHARVIPNVSIVQADATALPFQPACCDVVVAALVLCRLRDPLRGLAEMVRVLQPGGTLLLATPLGFRDDAHWELFRERARYQALLESLGLRLDQYFEGLRYREILDAQGNAQEWNVRITAATLQL